MHHRILDVGAHDRLVVGDHLGIEPIVLRDPWQEVLANEKLEVLQNREVCLKRGRRQDQPIDRPSRVGDEAGGNRAPHRMPQEHERPVRGAHEIDHLREILGQRIAGGNDPARPLRLPVPALIVPDHPEAAGREPLRHVAVSVDMLPESVDDQDRATRPLGRPLDQVEGRAVSSR